MPGSSIVVGRDDRALQTGRMLAQRSRELLEPLREFLRLTVLLKPAELDNGAANHDEPAGLEGKNL